MGLKYVLIMVKPINIPETKSITKWGNSHVFIVPNYLIKAGIIDPTKEYKATLTQVKEAKEESKELKAEKDETQN